MMTLKKTVCVLVFMFLCARNGHAEPLLQLDILGGSYDPTTETIVAPQGVFTLFAYLNSQSGRFSPSLLSKNFFISAALHPAVATAGGAHGSFVLNGQTIQVASDMTYGTPPLEAALQAQGGSSKGLPSHGIFPTYFSEFAFQFGAQQSARYNTQDFSGQGPQPGQGMYFNSFTVDTRGLTSPHVIHFDLYSVKEKKGEVAIEYFAPFSHDAESGRIQVPEPHTISLLAGSIFWLALVGWKVPLRQRQV